MSFKRSIILLHIQYSCIHTWRNSPCNPLVFLSPCWFPFIPPLYPPLLTWHPPAMTGIVHLRLRLLVNWPHLPHPSPNCPTLSKFPEPQLPAPNKDDLGNIPALAIRNNYSGSFSVHKHSLRKNVLSACDMQTLLIHIHRMFWSMKITQTYYHEHW